MHSLSGGYRVLNAIHSMEPTKYRVARRGSPVTANSPLTTNRTKRTGAMSVAPSHPKSIVLFRAGSDSALRLAKVFGVSVPVDVFSPYLIFGRPSFLVHRWSISLLASYSLSVLALVGGGTGRLR